MRKNYMELVYNGNKEKDIIAGIKEGLSEFPNLEIRWSCNHMKIYTLTFKDGGKLVAKFMLTNFDCSRIKLTEEERAMQANYDIHTLTVQNLYFKTMAKLFEGYEEDRQQNTCPKKRKNSKETTAQAEESLKKPLD